MRRDPHYKRNLYTQVCSMCKEHVELASGFSTSETYNNLQKFFKWRTTKRTTLESHLTICPSCFEELSTLKKPKGSKELSWMGRWISIEKRKHLYGISISIVGALLIIVLWSNYKTWENIENGNVVAIDKLRKNYPSQENETWYHFLSVLDQKNPSVKSITFLQGNDKRTSDCLVKELVLLHAKNRNLKNEEITFSEFKADDYGFVLEHYHKIVKKFGILITDLNKASGNMARIFHSLCDEVSSNIKPSLFIFTLKCDERTKTLKPVRRASSELRKIWHELPESELFPLLSRVVKNVVDVVAEHQISC